MVLYFAADCSIIMLYLIGSCDACTSNTTLIEMSQYTVSRRTIGGRAKRVGEIYLPGPVTMIRLCVSPETLDNWNNSINRIIYMYT